MKTNKALGLLASVLALLAAASCAESKPEVTVYKSPSCKCCVKWMDHLEEEGFAVVARDVPDLRTVKRDQDVPPGLQACHTGLVGGYVIEGHVPAADIRRLLRERPAVRGIAVPGMPIGSPGMEGPGAEPYAVLSFDADGSTETFSSYTP